MDGRLREIERRAALGDPGARRRYLLERVRAGDLTPERLRLASYLGDPAARDAQDPDDPPSDLESLVRGLSAWSRPALIRAGVALVSAALEARSGLPDKPSEITLRTVEAARTNCLSPDAKVPWFLLDEAKSAAVLAVGVDQDIAWVACEVLAAAEAEDDAAAAAHVAEAALIALRVLRADVAQAAVREALVPWALGEGDPLQGP